MQDGRNVLYVSMSCISAFFLGIEGVVTANDHGTMEPVKSRTISAASHRYFNSGVRKILTELAAHVSIEACMTAVNPSPSVAPASNMTHKASRPRLYCVRYKLSWNKGCRI